MNDSARRRYLERLRHNRGYFLMASSLPGVLYSFAISSGLLSLFTVWFLAGVLFALFDQPRASTRGVGTTDDAGRPRTPLLATQAVFWLLLSVSLVVWKQYDYKVAWLYLAFISLSGVLLVVEAPSLVSRHESAAV